MESNEVFNNRSPELPGPRMRERSATWQQIVTSIIVCCVVLATCCLGGFLNRCRGGLVNLSDVMDYWSAHVCSRLILAVPTGIIAGLAGRSGVVFLLVTTTTWCSLFVSWGCYFSIGLDPSGYKSRSGVFDWLLGRQEALWSSPRRTIRDYAGMSLRGLVWTTPGGYALCHMGYGCGYSLSGSLMAVTYYVANSLRLDNFCSGTACSEYVWGFLVWLFLFISILSSKTLGRNLRNQSRGPGNQTPTAHLNNTTVGTLYNTVISHFVFKIIFEASHGILAGIFFVSTIFYSLVEQTDLRNKTQTFFGVQISGLLLIASQVAVITKFINDRRRNRHRRREQENDDVSEPWTAPVWRQHARRRSSLARSGITNETESPDTHSERSTPPSCQSLTEADRARLIEDEAHRVTCWDTLFNSGLLLKIGSGCGFSLLLLSGVSFIVTMTLTINAFITNLHVPRFMDCSVSCS